jgi:DNA-binding GntR family transcriptional regulator
MSAGNPVFQTKSAYATAKLREALQQGEYAPGQRLHITKLAKELGLSLTPVREALAKLASEGLVEVDPHRGARVADIPLPNLSEVYMLRMMLEPAAARLATERIGPEELDRLRGIHDKFIEAASNGEIESLRPLNDKLHFLIYDLSRSPLLLRLIRLVWAMAPHDTFMIIPDRAARSITEHEKILDALEKHDAERMEETVRNHIEESFDLIRSTKKGAADRQGGSVEGSRQV